MYIYIRKAIGAKREEHIMICAIGKGKPRVLHLITWAGAVHCLLQTDCPRLEFTYLAILEIRCRWSRFFACSFSKRSSSYVGRYVKSLTAMRWLSMAISDCLLTFARAMAFLTLLERSSSFFMELTS